MQYRNIFFTLLICACFVTTAHATLNDLVCDSANHIIWGMDNSNNTVKAINQYTGGLIADYTGHTNVASGAMDTINNHLWVSDNGANTVSIMNPATGAVMQTLTLNGGTSPGGVAFEPETPSMWVACNGNGKVLQFGLDGTLLHTYTTTEFVSLVVYVAHNHSMCFGSFSNTAHGTKVVQIIIATGVISYYTVGDTDPAPYAVAAQTGTPYVWSANYQEHSISIINVDTGVVTTPITGVSWVNGIVFDSNFSHLMWVSVDNGNLFSVDVNTYAKTTYTNIGTNLCFDSVSNSIWGGGGSAPKYTIRKLITKIPLTMVTLNHLSVPSTLKLLVHFDESNNTFKDYSGNSTLGNTGVTYVSGGKFSGAGYFDGNSYLTIPYNGGSSFLNFGTGDFTIGWWTKMSSLAVYSTLIGQNPNGTLVHLYSNGTMYLGNASGYTALTTLNTSTLTDGNWHYIEICRVSGTDYMSLDGIQQSVVGSSDDNSYSFMGSPIQIGSQTGVNDYGIGDIDELVIYVGVGLHTTNFTPAAYPTLSETIIPYPVPISY